MPNAPNKFLYQFLTTLLSIQFFFASSPPAAWVGCFAKRNEFGPASLAEKPRLPAQENANDVASLISWPVERGKHMENQMKFDNVH